jgi:hypothetical protein
MTGSLLEWSGIGASLRQFQIKLQIRKTRQCTQKGFIVSTARVPGIIESRDSQRVWNEMSPFQYRLSRFNGLVT